MLMASITDPSLEKLVQEKLQSGEFHSVDEIVAAGLAMLANDSDALLPPEELGTLRQEIAIGIEQADRGETAEWNSEDIKAAVRKRIKH